MAIIELLQDEKVLLQKSGEYTKGSNRFNGRVNGKLTLTNERFIFKTSGMVLKALRVDFEIPLSEIEQAIACGICFGLKIISKNGEYNTFRITGRSPWIRTIHEYCNK